MKALIKKPGFFYKLKQEKYKEKDEERGPSFLGQIYKNVKIKISRSFTQSSCSSSHVR